MVKSETGSKTVSVLYQCSIDAASKLSYYGISTTSSEVQDSVQTGLEWHYNSIGTALKSEASLYYHNYKLEFREYYNWATITWQ